MFGAKHEGLLNKFVALHNDAKRLAWLTRIAVHHNDSGRRITVEDHRIHRQEPPDRWSCYLRS